MTGQALSVGKDVHDCDILGTNVDKVGQSGIIVISPPAEQSDRPPLGYGLGGFPL